MTDSWESSRKSEYIAMAAKMLEKLNLSQGTFGQNFLAEDVGDLFDSDAIPGDIICCRAVSIHLVSNPEYSFIWLDILLE